MSAAAQLQLQALERQRNQVKRSACLLCNGRCAVWRYVQMQEALGAYKRAFEEQLARTRAEHQSAVTNVGSGVLPQ